MELRKEHKKYINKHHPGESVKHISEKLGISEKTVKQYLHTKPKTEPLSRGKKIQYTLITLSIPFLFFLALEIALRFMNYGGNQSLFIYPEQFGGEYAMLNPDYHQKFFSRTTTFEAGRGDIFLEDKPVNGFRVFALGASTTEGFPYGHNGTFSLVLRDMLKDVLPDHHVEVVNLGITATNSYTVYDQTQDIIDQEPDAILIYSGQNEYYGALGIASAERMGGYPGLVRFTMKLYHYRTFLLIRDFISSVSDFITGFSKYEAEGTLMQRMASQHAIPLNGSIYEAGINQYRSNVELILSAYRSEGIPVFLSSLVSNLKDQPPFYSVETPGHPFAQQVWEKAKTEYDNSMIEDALQSFRYARDLDGIRFRAPSVLNDVIRQFTEMEGVWYVPMKEQLSAEAENGIIGFDLMVEHLHPNHEGYFLMGKVFFDTMAESNHENFSPNLSLLRDPDVYKREMYLSELDHRIVWHRVQALMNSWPFVDQPDPDGYPANYSPSNELDRIAINFSHGHTRWEEAKTNMARWYSDNGMHREAVDEIMGALRVVPYEEEAWRFAGWIASRGEIHDEAIIFFETANKLRPTNLSYQSLGLIMVDLEKFDKAGPYFEEAFRYDRRDYDSLFNASVAYASAENYDRALQITEQLLQVQPNYPNLQQWRSHLMDNISNSDRK